MSLLPRGYYISVVKRYKQKQTMRGILSDELPVDWSLCATVAWSHIQEVSVPTPTQSRRGIQNSHPGRLPIKTNASVIRSYFSFLVGLAYLFFVEVGFP